MKKRKRERREFLSSMAGFWKHKILVGLTAFVDKLKNIPLSLHQKRENRSFKYELNRKCTTQT